MDEIQKVLIKAGRKDLAQKYYEKVAQVDEDVANPKDPAVKYIRQWMSRHTDSGQKMNDLVNFVNSKITPRRSRRSLVDLIEHEIGEYINRFDS